MTSGTTPSYLLVGGYTPPEGGGAGLTVLRRDADEDVPRLVGTLALDSPSYLVSHPRRPWVFAVSEGAPSQVHSIALGADGTPVLLSSVPSGGDGACHLVLAPDGRRLVVAHYGSGSVSSVAVGTDGRLSGPVDVHTFGGSGPDADRQQTPHAHQVVIDGEELLVCDLGTDRVHRLRLGADGGLATAGPPTVLPPGSGPRHLVVLHDHLVVACELSGELWLGRRGTDGGWQQVDRVPCSRVPSAAVSPSALRADGDQVLVANRGPGTVATFTVDADAGTLTPGPEFGCGGAGPRDLVVLGEQLWVANEADGVLSVIDRRPLPPVRPPRQLPSPSPVCIVLAPSWER